NRVRVLSQRAMSGWASGTEPRLQHATALMKLGKVEEANAELEQLRREAPAFAAATAIWAECQVLRNRPADAIPALEHAAPLVGTSQPWYVLGVARGALGRFPDARDALAEAVRLDPANYDAWIKLAMAAHMANDPATRDQALAQAARLPQARDGRVQTLRNALHLR